MQFDFSQHPLRDGFAPDWADEWGQDKYGIWVAFSLPWQDKSVRQCLRWIPPGAFLMGSPKDEPGRFKSETQHLAQLTQGFWLFDTPVTQALWQALMGENPSYFQSPERPVEQVSWEDCQQFCQALQKHISGVRVQLPTEAQWEFACRAGTKTATYAGAMEIKGENNAPVLDEIAWYGGNSGVDFELDNGYDSASWSEKQYEHKSAGTHPVAKKQPNPWGLYDMLGNVREWCQDYFDENDYQSEQAKLNPLGPDNGSGRVVVRGGFWGDDARNVRAACRNWYGTLNHHDFLGFRCALVQHEPGKA